MPDDKDFDKIPGNMWFLKQFKDHLNKKFGKNAVMSPSPKKRGSTANNTASPVKEARAPLLEPPVTSAAPHPD